VGAGSQRNIFTSYIPRNGAALVAFMLGDSLQCLIYLRRDASGYAVSFDKIVGIANVQSHAYIDGTTAFSCTSDTDNVLQLLVL